MPGWAGLLLLLFPGCAGGAPPGDDAGPPDAAGPDAGEDAASAVDAGSACDAPLPPAFGRDAPHRLVARCSGFDLAVELLQGGIAHLRYTLPGAAPRDRSWAVVDRPAPAAAVCIAPDGSGVRVRTGETDIAVDARCRLRALDAAGHVLADDGDDGGLVIADREGRRVLRLERLSPPGERIYGLGERTGPLDRRGRRLVFYNTDAYDPALGGYRPDADPLYQSIPFAIALRDGVATGVFTDHPWRLEMDVGASDPGRVVVDAFGDELQQYLLPGPTMPDVLRRYAALTGPAPLPPRWALGYHQCRWGYGPADRVRQIGQRLRDEGFPADALWLDIQHMDGFRTFTWDPAAFPDPAGLASELGASGFRLVVIADPGLKVDDGYGSYRRGLMGGHFLSEGGRPWVGVVWPGPSVFPDFTRGATRAFWGEEIGTLLDRGVSGIWLDVNEPTTFPESGGQTLPDTLAVDGDGRPTTMAEAHNVYALLEARATFDGMQARAPTQRPFVLSRAGYAGIQRYAAVWTGDAPSRWESLRTTLPMLLGLGLSGVPFVGSDVGGYSGSPSPELFLRWMAVGSISPFFRNHVTTGAPDQEPWAFGPAVLDASRRLARERYALLPYLYSLFDEAHRTGAPVLRPLVYEHAADAQTHDIDDQALLGSALMLAPVLEEGVIRRTVYFPAGLWMDDRSGALFEGPGRVEVAAGPDDLPRFVREGAIVPSAAPGRWSDERAIDPLRLDVFPSERESRFVFYEDAGDGYGASSRITYTLVRTPDGARLTASAREGSFVPAPRTLLVRVRPVDREPAGAMISGAPLPRVASEAALLASGRGFAYDAASRAMLVALPDGDDLALELIYDATLEDLRPPVRIDVRVRVPDGTPLDRPVHVALSTAGWMHLPLAFGEPGIATGSLEVPRGERLYYKYSRGDWSTVEKWPGCAEGSDRTVLAVPGAVLIDEVAGWRDWCE